MAEISRPGAGDDSDGYCGLAGEVRPWPIAKPAPHATGYMAGTRRVRPDGTVRFRGRRWKADPDALRQPVPGEWLGFSDYGDGFRTALYEWTAPADPDGYIRRMFWRPAEEE